MIKINLISEGKRPVTARRGVPKISIAGTQDVGQWMALAGVFLGILVFAGWYFIADRAVTKKQVEVAAAQREVDELALVIKEVDEYKGKKAELEHKIAVINQLKLNQRGPVQIMDQVSRAVPELLWLTQMDVTPSTITLRGEAFNTNAVANLIENLDHVPEFSEPVLNETTQRGPVYDFVLTFAYQLAKAPAPGQATATPAPKAG